MKNSRQSLETECHMQADLNLWNIPVMQFDPDQLSVVTNTAFQKMFPNFKIQDLSLELLKLEGRHEAVSVKNYTDQFERFDMWVFPKDKNSSTVTAMFHCVEEKIKLEASFIQSSLALRNHKTL